MVIGPLDDRTYCARSALTHLYAFIASLHNQPMYPKMCAIDIFVNLPIGWLKFDWGTLRPPVWGIMRTKGEGAGDGHIR